LIFLCTAAAAQESADLGPYGQLTAQQHLRIEQITSIYENSTPDFQYSYIEDIGDGAGITAGRIGFTNDGGLRYLAQEYSKINPNNPLARYVDCLKANENTGNYACLFPSLTTDYMSTQYFKSSGLMAVDFGAAFKLAAQDPAFRKIQDDYVEKNEFIPAFEKASALHVTSALGVAIIYDTEIQMGEDAPGGIDGIVSRMASQPADEAGWLTAFMESRKDTLAHPFRPDGSRMDKPDYDTVPRADSLIELLDTRNFTLTGPVRFTYCGQQFELNDSTNKE